MTCLKSRCINEYGETIYRICCCCGYTSDLSPCCFHGDNVFFSPPFRFQCHPASPATAYRQGKNSDCVDGLPWEQLVCLRFVWLITCAPSLALAHPLTLARVPAIMHVVELSADRGMHRLQPVQAAAILQKANVDQREAVCASILSFLWKLNVIVVCYLPTMRHVKK